ncbi:hypothetical protein ACKWRH_11495 [Bradyrhizobium sp. Pa8]|uniref:hypothetical protein n=1 Tax=Bradyrhizobium sp. Pa8 TaxID=3386552 RepID=UPI00403F9EE2
MSFQLSILKILAGQPDGRGTIEVVKQHLAIFYTSGPDWVRRMRRLAEFAPNLDLFGQQLVTRERGTWIITNEGRVFLAELELRAATNSEVNRDDPSASDIRHSQAALPSPPKRPLERRQRRRKKRSRGAHKRSA